MLGPAITIACLLLGLWAMLSILGGERQRRLTELEHRLLAEAQAAEEAASSKH